MIGSARHAVPLPFAVVMDAMVCVASQGLVHSLVKHFEMGLNRWSNLCGWRY